MTPGRGRELERGAERVGERLAVEPGGEGPYRRRAAGLGRAQRGARSIEGKRRAGRESGEARQRCRARAREQSARERRAPRDHRDMSVEARSPGVEVERERPPVQAGLNRRCPRSRRPSHAAPEAAPRGRGVRSRRRPGTIAAPRAACVGAGPAAHAKHPTTPTRLSVLEPRIRAFTEALVDSFLADGRVELMRAFAFPQPMRVMLDRMRLP